MPTTRSRSSRSTSRKAWRPADNRTRFRMSLRGCAASTARPFRDAAGSTSSSGSSREYVVPLLQPEPERGFRWKRQAGGGQLSRLTVPSVHVVKQNVMPFMFVMLLSYAPVRFAPLRFAPLRFAPNKYAPVRLTFIRSAPVRFVLIRSRRSCSRLAGSSRQGCRRTDPRPIGLRMSGRS